MIMATGAIDAQPKHSRPDGANNVVEFVVAFFLDLVLVIWVAWTPAPKNPVARNASVSPGESSSPAICQATNLS